MRGLCHVGVHGHAGCTEVSRQGRCGNGGQALQAPARAGHITSFRQGSLCLPCSDGTPEEEGKKLSKCPNMLLVNN